MKLTRPILLAFLLPLLLDLLVALSWQPFATVEEAALRGQEAAEMLEGFAECEGLSEEDGESFVSCLSHADVLLVGKIDFLRCASPHGSCNSAPLAFGWRMPLRI